MSNPNPAANNNKENVSDNQNIPAPRYACSRCPKTFSTPMALGGHQNAHRQRPEKRPFFTSQGMSGPSSSPALRGPVRESPSSFSSNCRYLQQYFAARKRRDEYLQSVRSSLSTPLPLPPVTVPLAPSPSPAPSAPPAQPGSTVFFGVRDFFQPADGASSAGRVLAEEDEEEEEEETDLDLDLKL